MVFSKIISRYEKFTNETSGIPECFKGGDLFNLLLENGHGKAALALQERIVSENERDESEQLRLLGMMVKFEQHGTKEKLYELIKKGMDFSSFSNLFKPF